MCVQRSFYRDDEEFRALHEGLKIRPCPHCKVVGMLVLHGFLRGYDESSRRQKAIRAHRVYCSNRNARRGCGRTFGIWLVDKIRRVGVTTGCLHRFLNLVIALGLAAATRAIDCHLSDRTLQRTWSRFTLAQSNIRTALTLLCDPPQPPAGPPQSPAAQVLAHLRAAFPGAACPIAAFQHATRTFFL